MSKGEFGESEFQKYQIKRKDALIVEAVRFDREKTWPSCVTPWKESGLQPRDMSWGFIQSKKGISNVINGDWIIKENDNFFCVCKPHIFRAKYQKVETDDRESQCVRACDGIPDPEATIPKLIELQKLVLDLPPIIKDVLVAEKMLNSSEFIDNLDTLAQEALERVSDE